MAKAAAAKSDGWYDVHPSVVMVQKWLAELKGKTGRSLGEWIALAKKEGPKDAKARLVWLKTRHGFGTNNARWIAERVDGKNTEEESPEGYLKAAVKFVEEQYAGPKEKLRPIYDELLTMGKGIAADVKACPCQTMVPLYREHVFAQIKPTTNTRIDMGFALAKYKGKLPKRLIDTGGLAKKDRITHRIELKSAGEIDEEVKKWMRTAYELDA
jgi:Domain of unknown function (DUF5655)/Domain of unknown function (DUF4287)